MHSLIHASVAALLMGWGTLSAQDPVDFNRDIRPLLSDRCFQCHGFDAQARQAGLRLDTWEGLTTPTGGRRPIVPGSPADSEVIRRITADDTAERMPPASSGHTLSAAEIALLRRWVKEGAPFARHWAFEPPRKPTLPRSHKDDPVRSELDRFVSSNLRERGFAPSPEAAPETLARRATLALTGLPPTPEELDTFLADEEPGAYERLVDRLLGSPRFGERMALMWMDVARYADTNGYHHDNIRTAWPYRDWVINAFNQNKPYDTFVREQLAGDLMEDPTVAQRIATAFCRMHNINDEGGALDPEYRVEAVADRIETVATTFMGLTFTCSRCHDHKYDPLTQEDYYSLFAYFNSVEERGVYPRNYEQARAYPARILYRSPDAEERLAAAREEQQRAQQRLDDAASAVTREIRQWEQQLRERLGVSWPKTRLVDVRTVNGTTVERLDDGSIRATGGAPDTETYVFRMETQARGLRLIRLEALGDPMFKSGSAGLASNGNAVVSHVSVRAAPSAEPDRATVVPLTWAWADHEQPNGDFDVLNLLRDDTAGWAINGHVRKGESRSAVLVAEAPFGFEDGTLVEVRVTCASVHRQHLIGRPRITLGAAHAPLEAFPTVASDWFQSGPFTGPFDAIYATDHGPEKSTAVPSDPKPKWKHRPDIIDGQATNFSGGQRAFYFGRSLRTPVPRKLPLSLGSDDAIKVFLNGVEIHANKALRGVAPDQERVVLDLPAGESALVVKIVNNGGPGGIYYRADRGPGSPAPLAPAALIPHGIRAPGLDRSFTAAIASAQSETYARLSADAAAKAEQVKAVEGETVPVLVMKELEKPTATHVLARGSYLSPDTNRPVKRRPPELFGGQLPAGAPENRLGFARWLTDRSHPLTARVHVNRIWQLLFGAGIVETMENFGHQASWPSNPELLDWLAVEFMDSGWDQKDLIRDIVTSATFRQSSRRRPEIAVLDPSNRWMGWYPRRRLEGEIIRDQALFVGGALAPRVGGPSVRPYQPPGLWREVSIGGNSNTQIFKQDSGEALYRRSLYTFWKRTSPNPQMATFDAPTREFCVVRRDVTNTPLQALVLWNDEQFVEAARLLAQRDGDVAAMFRRCTGRSPDPRELRVLNQTLSHFQRRFESSPDDARKLLSKGEAPLPTEYEPATLAALTMTANTILSLDATIVLN